MNSTYIKMQHNLSNHIISIASDQISGSVWDTVNVKVLKPVWSTFSGGFTVSLSHQVLEELYCVNSIR